MRIITVSSAQTNTSGYFLNNDGGAIKLSEIDRSTSYPYGYVFGILSDSQFYPGFIAVESTHRLVGRYYSCGGTQHSDVNMRYSGIMIYFV